MCTINIDLFIEFEGTDLNVPVIVIVKFVYEPWSPGINLNWLLMQSAQGTD